MNNMVRLQEKKIKERKKDKQHNVYYRIICLICNNYWSYNVYNNIGIIRLQRVSWFPKIKSYEISITYVWYTSIDSSVIVITFLSHYRIVQT